MTETDAAEELAGRVQGAPGGEPCSGPSRWATFSAAERVGMRLNCWKTKPSSWLRIVVSSLSERLPMREMCESLLANTVIEKYEIELRS